jgi:hypothetical protein
MEEWLMENLQDCIKNLIFELQDEQPARLGDLSKLNGKTLIAMEQALRFWCADGIARLINLPPENIDPWKVYDKAEKIAAELNLNELTECYLQTRDSKSLIALITLRLDVVVFQEELKKRMELRPVGRAFAHFWDNQENPESVSKLLNILGRQMNRLVVSQGWGKSPGVRKHIRALTKDYNVKADYSEKDFQQSDLLDMMTFYSNFKKNIDLNDVESLPVTFIGEFRKSSNPKWDQKAPGILRELLKDIIETRLPLISQEIEQTPLEIYNKQRASDLHETIKIKNPGGRKIERKRRLLSLSEFNDKDVESGDNKSESEQDRILFNALKSSGYNEWTEENEVVERIQEGRLKKRIGGIDSQLEKNQLLNWIRINLDGQPKVKQKALRYFKSCLSGKTNQESLKIAKISDRTARSYVNKLRVKLTG